MTTLFATFDGQVLRPEEPIHLAPNTRVRLTVEPAGPEPLSTEPVSFLNTARSLDLEGPSDWSARLDEYLYGEEDARARD